MIIYPQFCPINLLNLQNRLMDTFNLIEGIFDSTDAKEVLLGLVEYKIQFHNRRILSQDERFGIKDENSVERVKVLKEVQDQLLALIKSTEENDQKLVINSAVHISVE